MTEDVTVELDKHELRTVSFALMELERRAWQALYAAEGRDKLHREGREPNPMVKGSMPPIDNTIRADEWLQYVIALRERIGAVMRPWAVPAPERRAKEGAA